MAVVLSKDGEEVVYKTRRVEEGVKCDVCGKFIEARNHAPAGENKYYSITNSIENRDVCPECINGFVKDYLENEPHKTAYIEITTERTWPRKCWT